MRQHMIYCLLLITPILMLTGCSAMNNEFDCPMKPGVHCESIDRVNAKVDSGMIRSKEELSCRQGEVIGSHQGVSLLSGSPCSKKMNIWIAPYTDDQGNYHTASNVYASITDQSSIDPSISEV